MIKLRIMENMVIMPWIMPTIPRNMAAMPSSGHDTDHNSPCSWHGSHVFPTRVYRPDEMINICQQYNFMENIKDYLKT